MWYNNKKDSISQMQIYRKGMYMITNFIVWADSYMGLLNGNPWWSTIIIVAVHLCALLVLYHMNNGESTKIIRKSSHNTLHTSLWLIIILLLPFVGFLLFIILSVIPFIIWNKKGAKEKGFPLAFLLRRYQLSFIIIPGVIGTLLEKKYGIFEWNLGSEVAFLCWGLVVLRDWDFSHYNNAFFYIIKPSENMDRYTLPSYEILGLKHNIEEGSDKKPVFYFSDEAAAVRNAADTDYLEIALMLSKNNGIVTIGDKKFDYKRLMGQGKFNNNKSRFDTIDATYIGRGITRYVFSDLKEDSDQSYFEDTIMYRAVPRFRFFFMRSAILFVIYVALFTSVFSTVSINLINFIDSIVH